MGADPSESNSIVTRHSHMPPTFVPVELEASPEGPRHVGNVSAGRRIVRVPVNRKRRHSDVNSYGRHMRGLQSRGGARSQSGDFLKLAERQLTVQYINLYKMSQICQLLAKHIIKGECSVILCNDFDELRINFLRFTIELMQKCNPENLWVSLRMEKYVQTPLAQLEIDAQHSATEIHEAFDKMITSYLGFILVFRLATGKS